MISILTECRNAPRLEARAPSLNSSPAVFLPRKLRGASVRVNAVMRKTGSRGAAVMRPIGGTVALQWDGVSRTAGAGADGWHAVPAEHCRMRAAIYRRENSVSTPQGEPNT